MNRAWSPQTAALRHGHTANGGLSPTYQSWASMKKRCLNPTEASYANYGGRGIRICARWLNSFESFLADMGERPKGTTLDRLDPNGDYGPSNCRWATRQQQTENKRRDRKMLSPEDELAVCSLLDQGVLVGDVAARFGVSKNTPTEIWKRHHPDAHRPRHAANYRRSR